MSEQITVSRNDEHSRYEVTVDGELAGVAEFKDHGTRIAFTHTEVFEEHRGGPAAGTLADEALADAAERGLTIVPLCPYIQKRLKKHPIDGADVEWPDGS